MGAPARGKKCTKDTGMRENVASGRGDKSCVRERERKLEPNDKGPSLLSKGR